MNTLRTMMVATATAAAALMSPLACAHPVLKSSSPPAGAAVAAAPQEITLTFSERVEEAFSTVTLADGAGKALAAGKPKADAANPAMLRMHVPVLRAGAYSVTWAVAGHDGHRAKGNFKFSVK